MRKDRKQKYMTLLLAVAIAISSGVFSGIAVMAQQTGTSIEVTTKEGLLSALSGNYDKIVITESITVSNGADETGKMLPIQIPGGVTICGGDGISLDFRCPMQIAGDDVVIKDIELLFNSGTALGSVPHREIFLAGHSLTLDGVKTYLEGSGGSLGDLGGAETELLPTVYAGGFEGTSVGTNASLTIVNANSETVFEDIYMGHGEGTDAKVSYAGTAALSLCTKVSVRGGIYTQENSSATITAGGSGNLSDMNFYGNSATDITINQSNLYRAGVYNVGNVTLDQGAYLQLVNGGLHNIKVVNDSCIDYDSMTNVGVSGDFIGGVYDPENSMDTRGVLVLNEEGAITIAGQVKGSTWFYTENRNFAGDYLEKTYITAGESEKGADVFFLPQSEAEYYEIFYKNSGWTVVSLYEEAVYPTVTEIVVLSQPVSVDIAKIRSENYQPAPEAPYCRIQWKDEEGNVIDTETAEDMYGTVLGIKTEYWEDENCTGQFDWGNTVMFVTAQQTPGYYYFYAGQASEVKSGDYTYLFCDVVYDGDLYTVSDIRALGSHIKAQMKVSFYDSSKGEVDPAVLGNDPGDVSGDNPSEPGDNPSEPGNTPTQPQSQESASGSSMGAGALEDTNAITLKKPVIRKLTAKKKTKTVTVKGKKKTSKTIKRLKINKRYYVRIRTYKTIKVNGKSVKIYSKWSKVKKVTTK